MRYGLKSFIIINLGSLKRVGDKKRAVKKNSTDEPAKRVKFAQSSESQNDYRPFISFVFPLGPVGEYCVGNRPQEAESGEQAYSGWPLLRVVSRD